MSQWKEELKEATNNSMERFLRHLKHCPEDKLTWKPTPTAKSALQIAAHTAVTAGNFAQMILDRRLPQGDEIPAFVERTQNAERALTELPVIEKVFRENTAAVLAAFDTVTPEEEKMTLDSSLGWSMSMTRLMKLAEWHADQHKGQIDYLQTCWDDQQIYF